MMRQTFKKTNFASLLVVSIVLSAPVLAQSAAERAANAGELLTVKNFQVLRLHGANIKERGFAHGYLLAEQVRNDLEGSLNSLPYFSAKKFTDRLVPWSKDHFEWDADSRAELDGIYEGMLARLGVDGMHSKTLGRALTRDDLTGINVIADYYGPACSAFAAWDKRTADGGVVHGRTLDFPIGPKAIVDQVIVVSDAMPDRGENAPTRKAWIAIGWPGMVTEYTGINADGLIVCLHDADNFKPGRVSGRAEPRGLLLRRMLESIDPMAGDPARKAATMAAAGPTACGNLFQLTWPREAALKTSTTPSAILEFDPSDQEVQIRRMDDSGALVLTNHFRVRNEPDECKRFTSITNGLASFLTSNRTIGVIESRKLLMSAEQPVAAHSVYFFPDKREFYLAYTHNNVMSPSVAPTKFTMDELFGKVQTSN